MSLLSLHEPVYYSIAGTKAKTDDMTLLALLKEV